MFQIYRQRVSYFYSVQQKNLKWILLKISRKIYSNWFLRIKFRDPKWYISIEVTEERKKKYRMGQVEWKSLQKHAIQIYWKFYHQKLKIFT